MGPMLEYGPIMMGGDNTKTNRIVINPLGFTQFSNGYSALQTFGEFRRDFFEKYKRSKQWRPYGNLYNIELDPDGRWPSNIETRDDSEGNRWVRVTAPSPSGGTYIIKKWHRADCS